MSDIVALKKQAKRLGIDTAGKDEKALKKAIATAEAASEKSGGLDVKALAADIADLLAKHFSGSTESAEEEDEEDEEEEEKPAKKEAAKKEPAKKAAAKGKKEEEDEEEEDEEEEDEEALELDPDEIEEMEQADLLALAKKLNANYETKIDLKQKDTEKLRKAVLKAIADNAEEDEEEEEEDEEEDEEEKPAKKPAPAAKKGKKLAWRRPRSLQRRGRG